jgi:hypothetical protein
MSSAPHSDPVHSVRHEPTASIIFWAGTGVTQTEQSLIALAAGTGNVDYEAIIVDDASSDATAAWLATLEGDVRVIRSADRIGRVAAWNLGARTARGRHLAFLSSAALPRRGWLEALVAEVEADPAIAVVGSKLHALNGTIQHVGIVFSREERLPYLLYPGVSADLPLIDGRRELQAVAGDGLLIPRAVFQELAGFDDGYDGPWAEVDLCLRARRAGRRVVYQPLSTLVGLVDLREQITEGDERRFRERWADCDLADEDIVLVADGCARRSARDARGLSVIEPLDGVEERAHWQRVAEAQALVRAGELAALAPLLADASRWPADPSVLRWAAELCDRAGVGECAREYRGQLDSVAPSAAQPPPVRRESDADGRRGTCTMAEHRAIANCLESLDGIKDALDVPADELGPAVGCLFARLKHHIIRLRRGRREDWPFFAKDVDEHLHEICDLVNTRWLVSILDTYADHADPVTRRNAMLVSLLVTWEKLAWTAQLTTPTTGASVDPASLERLATPQPLWDGMETLVISPGANAHTNLFQRLRAMLWETPIVALVFATIMERMEATPGTVLGRLHRIHPRDLFADITPYLDPRCFGRRLEDLRERLALGNHTGVRGAVERILELARRSDDARTQLATLLGAAEVLAALGDSEPAKAAWIDAIRVARSMDEATILDTLLRVGASLARVAEHDMATQALSAAADLARVLDDASAAQTARRLLDHLAR